MKQLTDEQIQMLVSHAQIVSQHAYAPYSKFAVGAAILTKTNQIFTGCNVENASYGLTICAERNALFQMIAAGIRTLEALAVYTPTILPTPPCGACRQVLVEFNCDILVVCAGSNGRLLLEPLSKLLPFAFGTDCLK